ncbi:dihydrofolate reductase family protein [Chitinophaga silvisoli]|uniref:Dihydrofolate reductase n=1 Tax=Chitinophaga silvisoli TaxID=2291814 RepID=A0A3E1P5N9_9BACT|nr:dihydrofolate reductase family protein [Chitinophaga silvisoli]RFM35430.1 dihydrofolate reductase [Chitinophaga silvisoli]
MRKIIVTTFLTMDGVLQAPGGPDEDPTNGFIWGGWQFGYSDELLRDTLMKIMNNPFDLLLGRRTYEIFAAYWPYNADNPIGEKFNRINKYVVATTPIDTSWAHSILISTDVVNELKKLKEQDGPDLLVHGSGRLIQTLFENHLVDVLYTFTYPLTLGKGKKLFAEGTTAQQWKMTESAISPSGVIMAAYVPDGEVRIGSYVSNETSEAEIKRREKWRKGE